MTRSSSRPFFFLGVFLEGRWTKVENWKKSILHPLHKIQQLLLLLLNFIEKLVGEDAKGSIASKATLMRNSDAMLSLVGKIIHGDSEYREILHIKQHGIGFLPFLRT